ncbi:MAG: alkaline phosphatase, partial [Cellvibrionaceae bacterium]|nr:alkaline phosphatase [Cellvibrionaceae bacterium]
MVQITVDQLRGDMPASVRERLPEGGLRYLFEQGIHYQNAHYRHANTETAVGHATLFTGALPAQHGIVGNDWIDQATQAFVYNTEDDAHFILGNTPKPHQGVSPKNLLVPTIGDQLVSAGLGRVFSVSGKDRGAILPGGHQGKAFWYSKSSGQFVTSSYYYQSYPQWVEGWNQKLLSDHFRGNQWALSREGRDYRKLTEDDRAFEADLLGFGRTFPHNYGDSKYVPLLVGLSPPIDEITIDFALTMMDNESIGLATGTDMLAISLSATDYVGHLYGSGSLEAEDNLFRLDRQLAKLFTFIDERVGLENTLIVLSAD